MHRNGFTTDPQNKQFDSAPQTYSTSLINSFYLDDHNVLIELSPN